MLNPKKAYTSPGQAFAASVDVGGAIESGVRLNRLFDKWSNKNFD